jgi:hypothetical protein
MCGFSNSINLALNAAMEWLCPDVLEVPGLNHSLDASYRDRVFIVICPFRQMLGYKLN